MLAYILEGKGCSLQAYLVQISSYPVLKHLLVGIRMQCTMNKCQKKSHKNLFCVLKEDVGSDVLQHCTTTMSF